MTSIFSGGNVAGVESQIESLIPSFQNWANQSAGLLPFFTGTAGTMENQGQSDIYPTSLAQFQAGAQGKITPAQQAAVDQTKAQMDTATRGTYGNLGLGGSTMQTQDLGANDLSSLAQTQSFANMDETLGLQGLGTALNFENAGVNAETGGVGALTGAGSILGQGSSALAGVGNLAAGQQALQAQALGGIGSALGSKL